MVRAVGDLPDNLVVRVSASRIDGRRPAGFRHTSTVVSDLAEANCPSPSQGGVCGKCRACWDRDVANVAYGLR